MNKKTIGIISLITVALTCNLLSKEKVIISKRDNKPVREFLAIDVDGNETDIVLKRSVVSGGGVEREIGTLERALKKHESVVDDLTSRIEALKKELVDIKEIEADTTSTTNRVTSGPPRQ